MATPETGFAWKATRNLMRCGISAEISPTHGHRSRWHHESAHNSFSAVITCVVARILFALEGLLFMHNDSSFIFCVFHGTPTGPRRAAEAGGGLRRRAWAAGQCSEAVAGGRGPRRCEGRALARVYSSGENAGRQNKPAVFVLIVVIYLGSFPWAW